MVLYLYDVPYVLCALAGPNMYRYLTELLCVLDGSLSRLQRKMVEGSAMDTGERGANKVDTAPYRY